MDVNAVDINQETPLHLACMNGHAGAVKVLIQNGTDVNAVNVEERTAFFYACQEEHMFCVLQLLCFGAEIEEDVIVDKPFQLLKEIHDRVKLLRGGKRMGTTFMSNEEKKYMWNLAFSFTIAHRGAAFKAFYSIRSFITFHGIIMGPGYGLGDKSVWIFAKNGRCESITVGIFDSSCFSSRAHQHLAHGCEMGHAGSFSLGPDTQP